MRRTEQNKNETFSKKLILIICNVIFRFFLIRFFLGFLRLGHNQNIDVAFKNKKIYILPPLSGSSSALNILSSKSYTTSQVKFEELYYFTDQFDEIFYIWRADDERLISFYKKKLLNLNTIKKLIVYFGHKDFYGVKNFNEFCSVILNRRILTNPSRDKHLLLNKDFMLQLNNSKINCINMHEFLTGRIKLNSSNSMRIKELILDHEITRLGEILNSHNLYTTNFVDVVVVSSRKSGSTYVDRKLRLNSKLSLPLRIKETNYFSANFTKGIDWYLSQFDASDNKIRIDVCPTYGMNRLALQRIFLTNPSPLIVMLVREPRERVKSHYKHLRRNRKLYDESHILEMFPEVLGDSDYKTIYNNIMSVGFSPDMTKIISVDHSASFDTEIEGLFAEEIRSNFSISKALNHQNVSFSVRFKNLYLIMRYFNFQLNKIGIKFPEKIKSGVLELFKADDQQVDKVQNLNLDQYDYFFKEQALFLDAVNKNENISSSIGENIR